MNLIKNYLPAASLLVVVGCWSSDSEPPSTTPRDPSFSPQIWTWPARSGEPRDLALDHADCLRLAETKTSLNRRVGVMWDCMRRKGWHRMKGAGLNLGGQAQ